ncbi:plasmid recombination protein [Rhizobium ruizarguesonis]
MSFQYAHLESFSRKADASGRGTDFVFAEAARKPQACVHVRSPAPPNVVFGVGIQEVQEMHDAAAEAATTSIEGGKVKKIRKDQKTLHTVVASHPYTMAEIRSDPAKRSEAEGWEKLTLAWLQAQYGRDLKSVIRHEDESHFHVHAYIVPTDDPEMRAMRHHPGAMAKREIMAAGPAKDEDKKALHKRADAVYKQNMRAWQDSYHEAVGAPSGLTRLGPQRRRLTRAEWRREQTQAQALQKTIERARKVKASGEDFIERTRSEAEAIRTNAEREREAAARVAQASLAAETQARKAQEAAAKSVSLAIRYSGLAGAFRALWDGFRRSRIADTIRQELSGEIERVHSLAKVFQSRLKAEEKRRHESDRRALEATQDAERSRDAALKMQIERDHAFSILPLDRQQELKEARSAMQMMLRPSAK